MREIVISVQEEGQRLDRYLARYLPEASSGFIHKMLRKKNIKRNDAKATGSEKLVAGDRIQIWFSEETFLKFGAENKVASPRISREEALLRKKVRILYQDEDVVILHKPAGMLTQKAAAQDDCLNDWLYDYWRREIIKENELPASFRPSAANRLDRNTSGIVLCGITVKGLQTLSLLLKERYVEKYYLCIVKGAMEGKKKIYGYLTKDEKSNQVTLSQSPSPAGSPVETWYEVLKSSDKASLLKVKLVTGKSHQIRAHLASLGHPILGDPKYGDPFVNRQLQKEGIRHQLLHSFELIIPGEFKEVPKRMRGLHIIDEAPEEFGRIGHRYGFGL